jgi:hypothetical protein
MRPHCRGIIHYGCRVSDGEEDTARGQTVCSCPHGVTGEKGRWVAYYCPIHDSVPPTFVSSPSQQRPNTVDLVVAAVIVSWSSSLKVEGGTAGFTSIELVEEEERSWRTYHRRHCRCRPPNHRCYYVPCTTSSQSRLRYFRSRVAEPPSLSW